MRTVLVMMVLFLGLAAGGCGGDACSQAADRVKSCFESTDCSKLSAIPQAACMTYKSTPSTSQKQACDGQSRTDADKLNACAELDPERFCAACK